MLQHKFTAYVDAGIWKVVMDGEVVRAVRLIKATKYRL